MAGIYVKLSLLGEGTFGRAWLVKRNDTLKKYVVKEIKVQGLSESEKEQTLTEVRALAKCKHVNIIRYREAYVENGQLCIAMEYADGGDLQRKITQQKGELFPEQLIIDWFVQICFALQYIHKLNILHRDLKTQNIFLTSDNLVKVGDFGIARFLQDTLDHASTVIGTPFYLSPEICQKNKYNHKSDMWAAGCVLYELCTLKYPFNGCNITSLMVQILQGNYEPIPRLYGVLLDDLVSVLLKQDPSQRPSAEQVLGIPAMQPYVNHYVKRSATMKDRSLQSPRHASKDEDKPEQDKENLYPAAKVRKFTRAKSWGTPPKIIPLAERKMPSSADVRTRQWQHIATPTLSTAPKVSLYQDVLSKRSDGYSNGAKHAPKQKLVDMCSPQSRVKRAKKVCSKTYTVKRKPITKVTVLHRDPPTPENVSENTTQRGLQHPSSLISKNVDIGQDDANPERKTEEKCVISAERSHISSGYSSFESGGGKVEVPSLPPPSVEICKMLYQSVARTHEELVYRTETTSAYLESKFGSRVITNYCSLIRESILADIDFTDVISMVPKEVHPYVPLIIHMVQLDMMLK